MDFNISSGIQLSEKSKVTEVQLSSSIDTGDIPYISASSLIMKMEQVACNLIHQKLPENHTTISIEINFKQTIPIKLNEEITCSVHLKFIDEDKLFFDFALFNQSNNIIAIGAHEREIINKNEY